MFQDLIIFISGSSAEQNMKDVIRRVNPAPLTKKEIDDPRKCFFCGSKRKRNLILVSEDAIGNPELPDGLGLNAISKAIKYREDYKRMRRIYWVCLRCFYIEPRDNLRYRSLTEKKETNLLKKLFTLLFWY